MYLDAEVDDRRSSLEMISSVGFLAVFFLLDWWLVQEIRLRSRLRASAGVKNILRTVGQLQASAVKKQKAQR